MFLQKLVPFLPLPPKCNNSPACRPKKSKTCHTQQQNPQQRISVAALIGHSFYLLPSPPRQILQLAHPPLVVPLPPSCLVGCCVAQWQWPPSASQPVALPLVAPSICVGALANLTREKMRKRRQSPTCVSKIAPCKK